MKNIIKIVISSLFIMSVIFSCKVVRHEAPEVIIRLATYNASLFRNEQWGLIRDLMDTSNRQVQYIAEIIQIIRPDILALLEFDYDPEGRAMELFQKNYLEVSQHGNKPVVFPFTYVVPSNTGIPTLFDLNHDSLNMGPEDAFGFGRFPGQYAFAILSTYPFDTTSIRTFQYFLWKDIPGGCIPVDPLTGKEYYEPEVWEILRLSSKNHIDMPVLLPDGILHLLIAHPTPPTFDGAEDRNGKRNYDEIRFFADYITPGIQSDYIYDNKHILGGLPEHSHFVIMGDMNADPADGDSYDHAIRQLLAHPAIHHLAAQGHLVPTSKGSYENAILNPRKYTDDSGNPWHDTSVWGLRIDYILPSKDLKVIRSGVFWPESNDSLYYLVRDNASSDHYLVWMDVGL